MKLSWFGFAFAAALAAAAPSADLAPALYAQTAMCNLSGYKAAPGAKCARRGSVYVRPERMSSREGQGFVNNLSREDVLRLDPGRSVAHLEYEESTGEVFLCASSS